MKVGIFTNTYKDENLSVTKSVVDSFFKSGFEIYINEQIAADFKNFKSFDYQSDIKLDAMITVGGDGTILRIAGFCARHNIPILGINLGTLGFLTEIEKNEISSITDRLKNGEYCAEERTMLNVKHNQSNFYALNEVVISRESDARMLSLNVYSNGHFIDKFYSDGYIVSTPTGSTAYSLSAGGPIVSPYTDVFVLTPVNSHSLHSRALVISGKEVISLSLTDDYNYDARIIIDGNMIGVLEKGKTVTVLKADLKSQFIRFSDKSFYSKLLSKLNSWSVTK